MIDLARYVHLMDLLEDLETKGPHGAGEAAGKWLETLGLSREDERYVFDGINRLAGHPDGWGWEKGEAQPDLDPLVWTFHRAWVDRYGWEHTSRHRLEHWKNRNEKLKRRLT
jgi:hypothetical protein